MITAGLEKYQLKKNSDGFFQLDPLPTKEELSEFYEKKYYQSAKDKLRTSYSDSYEDYEVYYFKKKAQVIEKIYYNFLKDKGYSLPKNRKMIDIGCGEGFVANYFLSAGWQVKACDFSSFAVEKFNREIIPYFEQGDIYEIIDKEIEKGNKYDFLYFAFVLEHVLNPEEIINKIKKLMHKESLLFIMVPNDYSSLQQMLLDKKYIDKDYWYWPLDHLNYFTYESLEKFLNRLNLNVYTKQATFPTEIYAANNYSNYYKMPETGKQTHYARVNLDTFLIEQGEDKYIELMEKFADMNFTRAAIVFVSLGDNCE